MKLDQAMKSGADSIRILTAGDHPGPKRDNGARDQSAGHAFSSGDLRMDAKSFRAELMRPRSASLPKSLPETRAISPFLAMSIFKKVITSAHV